VLSHRECVSIRPEAIGSPGAKPELDRRQISLTWFSRFIPRERQQAKKPCFEPSTSKLQDHQRNT
jgi:hypothetical protein